MLKSIFRGILLLLMVLALATKAAATPIGDPPPGWIFELATVHPSALPTYTQFSTSFVGTGNTEFVSFAFREVPAFFAFSDPFVSVSTAPLVNLLSNPNFAGAVYGQNCDHNNSLGCPPGWGAWITPEDLSAIGQIATNSQTYGCNVGSHNGPNFWCDGSVQGYDAIYASIGTTTLGATYNMTFWLQDDSGTVMNHPQIDMFAYAGDVLPVGTIDIGTPAQAPEPGSLLLMSTGVFGLLAKVRRRLMK